MPIVRVLSIACLSTALILSGCSGGGGGGDSTGPAPAPTPEPIPNPAPIVTLLGSRAMPDGTISVSAEGAVIAGAAATFLIDAPADYPAIASVEAGYAQGEAPTTVLASTTTLRSAGRYAVAVSMPATIPAGARIFVRMVHADGAIVESGIEDFLLPVQ